MQLTYGCTILSCWPFRLAAMQSRWSLQQFWDLYTSSEKGWFKIFSSNACVLSFHRWFYQVFFLSGMCLGFALHFKIYPVIYCLPMAISLSSHRDLYSILLDLKNPARMRFTAGTILTFLFLTGIFYSLYGEEFLEETYLYHITRLYSRKIR